MPRFLAFLLAWALLASSAAAADFTVQFGVKTNYGAGAKCIGLAPGLTITGTGASEVTQDADGCIVPAGGSYMGYKAPNAHWAAGNTLNLSFGATTVDIQIVAARADVTVTGADTATSNQLNTLTGRAYGTPGALVLGDTIMVRDGTEWPFDSLSARLSLPTEGYAGAGTITQPGSGYTTGTYLATGGSGTGARLRVVTSSGQVVHVAVIDPGIGYQAGDVLTVSGGTGFEYTAIDLAAQITIRSETPDAGLAEDGANPRQGGGARFVGVLVNDNATTPYVPITWQYLDMEVMSQAHALGSFIGYRNNNGYGMSARNIHFAVPDDFTIASNTRVFAFQNRLGTIDSSYCYRCRRLSTGGLFREDLTLRSVVSNNVGWKGNGDGVSHNGTKNDVFGNFFRAFQLYGTSHQDPIQHTGFGTAGTTFYDVMNVYRNVVVQDGGSGTQGIFASDTDPPTQSAGIIYRENLLVMDVITASLVQGGQGPQILRNLAVSPSGGSTSRLYLKQGTGGYVDGNVYNSIYVDEVGKEQVGVEVTAENNWISDKTSYGSYVVNPIYTGLATAAAAKAAWSPILDGPLKNADGTYNGPLFPDGTWNDGTVYAAASPTSLSSSADLLTAEVGEPITITVQADAVAASAITATPSLSGVTGGFSPATAVIGSGQSQAQVVFTATSAGAAVVNFTNDSGLTNPAALNLTITSASTGPTSYTQTLNRSSVAVGGSIEITYTLNELATSPVVITPGVSGVTGVFSQPTVTIASGDNTGVVSFFTGALGAGQFTAANDNALSNPAPADFTVISAPPGLKLRFMRPAA